MELKNTIVLNGPELTLREGKAADPLPLKEPKIIVLTGDIHSVSAFLAARASGHSSQDVDKDKVVVTVDKVARSIVLQLDPENHYGATIIGKLEPAPELSPFHINENARFDRKSLHTLIKFSRLYFDDKNQHATLLAGLSKLRMKTDKEIIAEQDNAGNRKHSVEVNVIDDGGLQRFFFLTLPIFKGFPPQKIEVEVCTDVVNDQITLWLESVGLKEVTDSSVDAIIQDELTACEGFVIINK